MVNGHNTYTGRSVRVALKAQGGTMERREFLRLSVNAGALALLHVAGFGCKKETPMPKIKLPDLPYGVDALVPYISKETVGFHYGKHHRAYVDKTNRMVKGTAYQDLPLEDIIMQTYGKDVAIFNNAAQAWNHTFFWNSMKPNGGGVPTGPVSDLVIHAFGSHKNFFVAFFDAATSLFGSGWVWLVSTDETVKIIKTSNADTPLVHGFTPVLALDVWEHAYYLDYQNQRAEYVKAFLSHLVNWDFVGMNLGCCAPETPSQPEAPHTASGEH
jgi:Fe-Mn family superoxide dismutase